MRVVHFHDIVVGPMKIISKIGYLLEQAVQGVA